MLESNILAQFKKSAGLRAFIIPDQGHLFSNLISQGDINDVLNMTPLPHDDIRTINNGCYIDCDSVDSLMHALADGATLIINNAHRRFEKIREMTSKLGKSLASQAQTNLYFSQPGKGGFSTHYDTHDVLVFQISGAKSWKIYAPTTLHPLFVAKTHDRSPPKETPYLELTLSAGDILYVPRGHWHSALAEDKSSLHLTVGLMQPNGIDFMNWLAAEMTELSEWRKSWHSEPEEHFIRLASDLVSKLSDVNLGKRYLEFFRSRILNNQSANISLAIPGGEVFLSNKVTLAVRPAYSRVEYEDQCIRLHFEGKKVYLHLGAEPLMRLLESNGCVTMQQAYESMVNVEQSITAKLVRRLVIEGYIESGVEEGEFE